MVRSRDVESYCQFNTDPPHNGYFGSLIQKENFEPSPHPPSPSQEGRL
jgi:hypothetical protein